jgi:hypothetical protein
VLPYSRQTRILIIDGIGREAACVAVALAAEARAVPEPKDSDTCRNSGPAEWYEFSCEFRRKKFGRMYRRDLTVGFESLCF